jgi:hypothetical protein
MIQVRKSIFETNSSSTHSLTLCDESEFEKWKNGELVFDYYNDELVEITPQIQEAIDNGDDDFKTYSEFFSGLDYETFRQKTTTKSGDKVVAFGYYGYNG